MSNNKLLSIKKLTINWPNSKPQIFYNINVNKKYEIVEGQDELSEKKYLKHTNLSPLS